MGRGERNQTACKRGCRQPRTPASSRSPVQRWAVRRRRRIPTTKPAAGSRWSSRDERVVGSGERRSDRLRTPRATPHPASNRLPARRSGRVSRSANTQTVRRRRRSMVVAKTGGRWGQAGQIALPANAGSKPESSLVRWCVCVRGRASLWVSTPTASATKRRWSTEESGGLWGRRARSRPPRTRQATRKSARLAQYPIACPASGACVITAATTQTVGDERRWSSKSRAACGATQRDRAPCERRKQPIRHSSSSLRGVGFMCPRRRVHERRW